MKRLALVCAVWIGLLGGAQAAPYSSLTEPQKLEALAGLILRGQLDTAEGLVNATRFSPKAAPVAIMLRARIARARGARRSAIRLLRQGTKAYPDHRPLRMELADMLAQAGRKEAAGAQLRALIDTAPTHDHRRALEARLNGLDTDAAFVGTAFLSVIQDSNVNSGPSAQDVILFGLPFIIDPATQATSGTGLRFGGAVSSTRPMGRRWWMYGTARLTFEDFAGSIFDTQSLRLTAGLRKGFDNALYGAEAIYQFSARDFRAVDHAVGGRIYGSWLPAQGYVLAASSQYLEREFRAGAALNRTEFFTTASLTRRFSVRETLKFSLFHEDFDVLASPMTSYETFGVGLSYTRPLGDRLGATLGLRGYQKSFDAVFTGKAAPREDRNVTLSLEMDLRQMDVFGLSPRLSLISERNRSNVEIYDFSRASVGLTLARSF